MATEQAFTSKTTERIDAIASKTGWIRTSSKIGDVVEYRRKALYVYIELSVRGVITSASTNRRGGRIAGGSGKAAWVIDHLTGE